jgi:hypothetical protein
MVNVTSIYGPINTTFEATVTTALTGITVDIAKPNQIYKPTLGTPYVKLYLLPIEHTEIDVLGADFWETYEGLYQINVFTPAGRLGTSADTITDALVAGFISGKCINTGEFSLRIIRAWRLDTLEETSWFQTPVRIRWTAEIPRTRP